MKQYKWISTDLIEKGVIRLLTLRERYVYGLILLRAARREDKTLSSFLGVTFVRGRPILLYNTTYEIEPAATLDDITDVLEHEANHLLLLHPYRCRDYLMTRCMQELGTTRPNTTYGRLRAVQIHSCIDAAQEHAANEALVGTSKYVKENGRWFEEYLNKGMSSEEIADELLKQLPPPSTGGGGGGGSDTETVLGRAKTLDGDVVVVSDAEALNEVLAAEQVKQVLIEAKGRGLLPGHLAAMLDRIIDRKLLLKPVLRRYLERMMFSIPTERKPIRTRPSRRYPPPYGTGKIRYPKGGLCVITDTSGSMEDEKLEVIFGEIDRLSRRYPILWIGCDAGVYDVKRYRPGMWRELKFARGGTDYEPAIEKAHQFRIHKIVYITDAICPAPKNLEPRDEVLWIVFGKQDAKHLESGQCRVIRIEDYA